MSQEQRIKYIHSPEYGLSIGYYPINDRVVFAYTFHNKNDGQFRKSVAREFLNEALKTGNLNPKTTVFSYKITEKTSQSRAFGLDVRSILNIALLTAIIDHFNIGEDRATRLVDFIRGDFDYGYRIADDWIYGRQTLENLELLKSKTYTLFKEIGFAYLNKADHSKIISDVVNAPSISAGLDENKNWKFRHFVAHGITMGIYRSGEKVQVAMSFKHPHDDYNKSAARRMLRNKQMAGNVLTFDYHQSRLLTNNQIYTIVISELRRQLLKGDDSLSFAAMVLLGRSAYASNLTNWKNGVCPDSGVDLKSILGAPDSALERVEGALEDQNKETLKRAQGIR